jgi:hypothetical protein
MTVRDSRKVEYAIEQHSSFLKVIPCEEIEEEKKNKFVDMIIDL